MSDLEVKAIRKNLDISQTELAKLLGISLRTVQNWEAGEKIPNTKHEMLRNLLNDNKKPKHTKEQEFEYKFGSCLHPKGMPLIPIEAMAGYGGGETQVLELDCEYFSVPTFKGADFLIQVKGSSMYPKYNSGDIVACKKLQLNDLFFQWNKVYVLDTEQGAIIKRIDIGPDDDHVMIVSDNEKYRPFSLHKSKINAISIVMGVIRLE
ncbi:helix-turn-helix domain-containing protein [Flavobacterium psychrophilum]|uniref:S24 family peptidase n=1 Tax=Flavobacterium psychrophilum TaxID=96345 RepID=UPI000A39E902|nr:S24 family peptidase [Flavobacterium psychrophilum]EKT3963210.1 helix-turn-helix domain-containing protein [Flavobacterium psychrophilum]EKT4516665.1 helix-turn-helix domain-containing protein [Flavobacterium psychrophilum]OUD28811.1 hypothetical protein FPG92_01305 [Flavobacterium psychrophilum]